MLWIAQNLLCHSGFHDRTLVQDYQALGPFGGQREIMGDQQHRGAKFTRELLQMVEHLTLDGDVQR